MLYGFIISLNYFILENLKSVVDEIFVIDINILWIGLFAFFTTAPLCLVRRIEKFAFTFLIADILILATIIIITVYACLHVVEQKHWGRGVVPLNTETWLTVIGSAIYSYEGIGVVLPILEVTEKPKEFPKVLLAVLLTVLFLLTGFGEFCLFVYGDELKGKPLITMNLPAGLIV
jgi:proton-coupled amino acid transporter